MGKYLLSGLLIVAAVISACGSKPANPLLGKWKTPFQTPPFSQIHEDHFLPAFREAIRQHAAEIVKIAGNPAKPTFANTIDALEASGELLDRVNSLFNNLNSAHTNPQLQAIAKEIAPVLSKHNDDIKLNAELFQRIKSVWEQRGQLNLNPEQARVLDDYYKDFVRSGANLNPQQKDELRKINEELALLTLKFGENVLAEDNNFKLVIENKADLAGLTENIIAAAAEDAERLGHPGKWVFTLHKPSLIPFIQYSENRALREKIYKAYYLRGDNNNEFDNKTILVKIAALRVKRANLLGYPTHADFVLERNMAGNPARVYEFLNQIWPPALQKAKEELREMQAIINKEGHNFKLQPWDWWYYAEKLRKVKYDLDEEMLRPYFKLENVIDGAFTLANKLYGIRLVERFDLPKYHEDVKTFEVKEADGTHIGILYTDYFPRPSKRGGAWMNEFRGRSNVAGKTVSPVIANVGNFTKPTAETPSLLTPDEVLTLFHEFGHALHGLLSKCDYPRVAGTNVPRDFVELPSQIMENWAVEPEMLELYARHYQTNEPMPDDLIRKIQQSTLFNKGFETVEYLAASFLDMDYHTLNEPVELDVISFENQSLGRIGLIPEIISRYRSTYFRHIFAGGYSAGYYSYLWAEVLDADAFQAFKEKGLFDRATAQAFRDHVLAKGGSDDPMVLYKRFRGAEPDITPLLVRRGLK